MGIYKEKYNLVILDDGLLSSLEAGLISGILRWIDKEYSRFLNIYHVRDIKEAFNIMLKITEIDILISDMNLPYFGIPNELLNKYNNGQYGGIYFINEAFKTNPNMKVIVSSGWNKKEYSHLLDKRVKITLSKPYEFSELEKAIDTILQEVIATETIKDWNKKKIKKGTP